MLAFHFSYYFTLLLLFTFHITLLYFYFSFFKMQNLTNHTYQCWHFTFHITLLYFYFSLLKTQNLTNHTYQCWLFTFHFSTCKILPTTCVDFSLFISLFVCLNSKSHQPHISVLAFHFSYMLLFTFKHRHRRNVTSYHFFSLL